MKLESHILASNTGEKGTILTNVQGKSVVSLPLGEGASPTNETEILRGDFAKLLHNATKSKTEWRFGDQISSLDEFEDNGKDGGVRVTFQSGKRETFDLVVLADGVGSRTRKMVFKSDDVKFKPLDLC